MDLKVYRSLGWLSPGTERSVELIERKRKGKRTVIKRYQIPGVLSPTAKPKEYLILHDFLPEHPTLMKCLDWWPENNNIVALECHYYEGGDLRHVTNRGPNVPNPTEEFIWQVFRYMADVLAFLHFGYHPRESGEEPYKGWQHIIHHDIKPASILCSHVYRDDEKEKYPKLRLGDFSQATLPDDTEAPIVSRAWQGPEFPMATAKIDVWALGATIHALMHGRPPVKSYPRLCVSKERDWAYEEKAGRPLLGVYSKELNHCMMDCLKTDVHDRIDSKKLVTQLETKFAVWAAQAEKKDQEKLRRYEEEQERLRKYEEGQERLHLEREYQKRYHLGKERKRESHREHEGRQQSKSHQQHQGYQKRGNEERHHHHRSYRDEKHGSHRRREDGKDGHR